MVGWLVGWLVRSSCLFSLVRFGSVQFGSLGLGLGYGLGLAGLVGGWWLVGLVLVVCSVRFDSV